MKQETIGWVTMVLASLFIIIIIVIASGCVSQNPAIPQEQAQTADEIGPQTIHPIKVVVFDGVIPEAGTDVRAGVDIDTLTITVTTTASQQGSTKQDATQSLETGDAAATGPNTTADVSIPLVP